MGPHRGHHAGAGAWAVATVTIGSLGSNIDFGGTEIKEIQAKIHRRGRDRSQCSPAMECLCRWIERLLAGGAGADLSSRPLTHLFLRDGGAAARIDTKADVAQLVEQLIRNQ